MLGDIMKGLLAASLAVLLMKLILIHADSLINVKLVLGVVAVVGHIFSIFLSFKGGKGVATLLGMMISIHYEVALLCVGVFLITLLLTKYVSLASLISALSFPTFLLFVPRFQTNETMLIGFGFFLFIVIVWTHNKNIRRLVDGDESKTYLIKNQKKD